MPEPLRLNAAVCDEYVAQQYTIATALVALTHRPMDSIFSGWMNWVCRENPGALEASADAANMASDFFYERLRLFGTKPAPENADLRRVLAIIIRRSSSAAEVRKRILADARFQDRHPIIEVVTETSAPISFHFWGNRPVTKTGEKLWVRANRADTGELVASP